MFDLSFDRERRRITAVRRGFVGVDEVALQEARMRELVDEAGAGGRFDVLIDASKATVLPQATLGAVPRLARAFADAGVRRVAIVNVSALGGLQRQRIIDGSVDSRMFPDMAGAVRWLDEP